MNNENEKIYTITIDPTTQKVKPEKGSYIIGKIKNNLTITTGVTMNEFSKIVARPMSYTWFGGIIDGVLSNENWKEQSVFALDFDKGNINVEQVLERFHKIRIRPQLWYTTLRSNERLLKFRIVLFLETPVNSPEIRTNLTNGLLKMFPEADQSCKDAGRLYFGGIESYILHYDPIPTQQLIDNVSIELITRDNGRVRGLIPPTNISCTDLGEKEAFQYNIYRKYQFSPKDTSCIFLNTYMVGEEIIDITIARRSVKILDEFLNGTWMYHMELFGLATNLIYINGGMKLMKETMLKFNALGNTDYTDNNFNIIKYVKKMKYHPQPISKFSPYKEDSELYDLITASKNIRGHIEDVEPIKRIPLDEAERLFKESFNNALIEDKKDIYLFVLPTAIGKTESLVNVNAAIAAPTNDLKNEIGKRMRTEYISTPDPIEFENQSINRKIEYYYRIGKPKKVTSILYNIVQHKSNNYSQVDIDKANDYLNQLNESTRTGKTVLTTHSRVIHGNFNHDIIIFDEDPLKSLIEIKKMDLTDLRKIYYEIGNDIELNNVIQFLESSSKGVIYETPTHDIDIEKLIENVSLSSIQTNIFDFFSSTYFERDNREPHIIHYVVHRKLPIDKKVIILSATLPIFIYKKLYRERLQIMDLRDVEQVGEIIQYTNRSCSRNSLNRYVSDISKIVGDKPVLTFKSFGTQFKNTIKEMYFGNCSGYDSHKGKDLVVVGTPHKNRIEYFLTAKVLGINFNTTDSMLTFQKIKYNGYKFMFNCYEHEELREIQLSFIESDLIQAVGRSRTLREPAKVELYSNFPLRLTKKFIY